jgi:hypothetical protein
MTDWKPIETAPKDGTSILIGAYDITDGWQCEVSQWMDDCPYEDENGEYSSCMGFIPTVSHAGPTHWMELPEAPK